MYNWTSRNPNGSIQTPRSKCNIVSGPVVLMGPRRNKHRIWVWVSTNANNILTAPMASEAIGAPFAWTGSLPQRLPAISTHVNKINNAGYRQPSIGNRLARRFLITVDGNISYVLQTGAASCSHLSQLSNERRNSKLSCVDNITTALYFGKLMLLQATAADNKHCWKVIVSGRSILKPERIY